MKETYCQVEVNNLLSEDEDRLTSFAFEWGASGLAENLTYTQKNVAYDPKLIDQERISLFIFFADKPEEDFFLQLQNQFKGSQVRFKVEDHKDWLEEWKKGFEPFQFAGPFWIVPSWRPVPEGVSQPVFIDPGMAFGTGTHETTQLAAGLMLDHMGSPAPETLLDVGTGTGLLGILASRLAVKTIHVNDIDSECLRVAGENFAKNQVENVNILKKPVSEIKKPYDWVVANIIDGVLIQLSKDLKRLMKPKGRMLVSGILVENEDSFKKQFVEANELQIIERRQQGEWIGLILKDILA